MPISGDEFHIMNEGVPMVDLGADTTQRAIYRFILANADVAFRQREIVDAVHGPEGSVGPTLSRLEENVCLFHG